MFQDCGQSIELSGDWNSIILRPPKKGFLFRIPMAAKHEEANCQGIARFEVDF